MTRALEQLEAQAEGLAGCFVGTPKLAKLADAGRLWLRLLPQDPAGPSSARWGRLAIVVESLAVCACVSMGDNVDEVFELAEATIPLESLAARQRALDRALSLLARWFLVGQPTIDLRRAVRWAREAQS